MSVGVECQWVPSATGRVAQRLIALGLRVRPDGQRQLSVVDEYSHECLALKVDRGITSEDVIDTLFELFARCGVPRHVRCDNGPEFFAKALPNWLERVSVGTLSIAPGSPWENRDVESFHGRFRDDFPAMEIFDGV